MSDRDVLSPRQLTAAAFVAILSPLVRRFPRALAAAVGRCAWLSVLLSALPTALLLLVIRLFYRKQQPHTGFADILTGTLGRLPGRALTGLYGIWFLAYAGVLLRSGADRFISTVYPCAWPGVFVSVTAALCLIAALGRTVSLARTAILIRPLMAALIVAVFLLSAKDLDLGLLFPVTEAELLPCAGGALQLTNILASAAFLVFFSDQLRGAFRPRDYLGWVVALIVLLLLMTVSCLGVFGAGLTARMTYPFFLLVRDLSVLGSLERAEPVILALWALSDFIMISLLLQAAGKTLAFCFCSAKQPSGKTARRPLLLLVAAAAATEALLIPGDMATFLLLSESVVPLLNAVFAFLLPLPVLGIGLLRKTL